METHTRNLYIVKDNKYTTKHIKIYRLIINETNT